MATLVRSFLGLADLYKRTDGQRGVADIIEMLNDTSQDILSDFLMMECNNGDKHTHTLRYKLPDVAWGQLYQGIPQSKSETQQVDDTCGFVEAMSSVDERLLDLAGENRLAMRAQESVAFIESMAQELVTALFYHDTATDAKHPKGLSARFNSLGASGVGNQIIDAGGTGSDNTSVWFVTWSPQTVCALYPKGTSGGIKQEDKGKQRVTDSSGNAYYVEEELFRAYMGIAVKDYRYVARVANIDVSNLQAGSVDLYKFLTKAYYRMQNRRVQKVYSQVNPTRTVMYCNREVLEAMDNLSHNKGSTDNFTRLRPMEIEGKEVMSFRGIPIRETDALLNTEARIT